MLKNMKAKALAVLAALAMMLGLGAVASATAYAAESSGTLTVSGSSDFKGKNATAIRMFSATKNDDGGYGYVLELAWAEFFKTNENTKETMAGLEGDALSAAAYQYVMGLDEDSDTANLETDGTDTKLVKFASDAKAWALSHDGALNRLTTSTTDGATQSGDTNTYTVTFSSPLAYGYYLLYPEGGSTSVARHNDAMLVNVTDPATTVTVKSEYPTVDKTIIDKPESDQKGTAASDAQIGDTVWFQLESKVPDMSEYSSYVFKFHDTLSDGLTFNADSVTVKVGGTALTETSDYTVSQSRQNITIDLTSLYNKYKDQAGAAIVVTYSATLNESAVIGNDGNENSATVEYTNNPITGGTGTSQPDITKTHTFEFTIDKYTGAAYDGDATRLPGAQFHIVKGETAGDGTTMKFQQKTAGDATDPLVVIPLQSEGTELTPLTTPESGKITVSGLADGTYWIVEDKAPDGYNKLAEPIKVVITANYDETTGELTSHTVTYGDESTAAGNNVIPVQNNTGTLLPGTGGMGTVLFTVAGVALIALGVVWSLKRSKSAGRRH
ncbi:SpaH/EbpB family LPXTG-anchored major pilin [Bifidobacterium pullorum]|uniref:SpaH/EbpB family LPXTG-anchored major pilin n=1 Tax=Bifidobacterium pullorum TaxID=78448 RepID=UPI00242AB381|nr:SpaH/EbpB family LPXTG-anchored major pilin [Bifidobacterium pullorum]